MKYKYEIHIVGKALVEDEVICKKIFVGDAYSLKDVNDQINGNTSFEFGFVKLYGYEFGIDGKTNRTNDAFQEKYGKEDFVEPILEVTRYAAKYS